MHNPLDRPRPGLLIFDCDGVLVDSELIDARIRSECFQTEGFSVTVEDLRSHSGVSGAGMAEMILERFGRPMPEGFMQTNTIPHAGARLVLRRSIYIRRECPISGRCSANTTASATLLRYKREGGCQRDQGRAPSHNSSDFTPFFRAKI